MTDHESTLPPELEHALAQELEAMTSPARPESDDTPQLWRRALEQHHSELKATSRASFTLSWMRSRWATGFASAAAAIAITATAFVLTGNPNPSSNTPTGVAMNVPLAGDSELAAQIAPGNGDSEELFSHLDDVRERFLKATPGYDGSTPFAGGESFDRALSAYNDSAERQKLADSSVAPSSSARAAGANAAADTSLNETFALRMDSPEPGGVIELGPGGSIGTRAVIKTVRLDLSTPDTLLAHARVTKLLNADLGEFVQNSTFETDDQTSDDLSPPRTTQLTLRLRASALEERLQQLRELGVVLYESASADDVSDRRDELSEQLRTQRRAEGELLVARIGATTEEPPASLDEVNQRIQQLRTAIDHIDRNVRYATVLITISRPK